MFLLGFELGFDFLKQVKISPMKKTKQSGLLTSMQDNKKAVVCFCSVLSRGPFACKANVITTTPQKPRR